MAGQQGKEDPFVPVPRDEQKWAMTLLDKYLFSIDAFKFSEETYSHLQYQRRGWSGTQDPKNSRYGSYYAKRNFRSTPTSKRIKKDL